MSYRFGARSLAELATLHIYLQELLQEVLGQHDFGIIQGARTAAEQAEAFARGASKISGAGAAAFPHMRRGLDGRPAAHGWSWAVDVQPWINGKPLDAAAFGRDPWITGRWCYFAAVVQTCADRLLGALALQNGERWRLRWGGNWDRDAEILGAGDRRFADAYHFELERAGGSAGPGAPPADPAGERRPPLPQGGGDHPQGGAR